VNLVERINELGYHTTENDYDLIIYLHGNYIASLYRFERHHLWVNKYNKRIDLFSIEKFLNKEINT